jgi:hypothetical protein
MRGTNMPAAVLAGAWVGTGRAAADPEAAGRGEDLAPRRAGLGRHRMDLGPHHRNETFNLVHWRAGLRWVAGSNFHNWIGRVPLENFPV